MAKTLTMRLDDETYEAFVRAARAERRSLAKMVETAALGGLGIKQGRGPGTKKLRKGKAKDRTSLLIVPCFMRLRAAYGSSPF